MGVPGGRNLIYDDRNYFENENVRIIITLERFLIN
jgi:hypothetical protein